MKHFDPYPPKKAKKAITPTNYVDELEDTIDKAITELDNGFVFSAIDILKAVREKWKVNPA